MADYNETVETVFTQRGTSDVNRGYDAMSAGAGRYGQAWQKVQAGLEAGLPYLGQWGQQLGAATQQWTQANAQASKIGSTFDTLAKKQGLSPEAIASLHKFAGGMIDVAGVNDEDVLSGMSKLFSFGFNDPEKLMKIMPALAATARDYGMSMDESAKMVGKAISAGNIGSLTKSGVLTMDLETRATVKKAKALLDSGDAAQYAAGQQLLFNMIVDNANKYASDNAAFMQTAAGRAQQFAERSQNVQEQLGAGAEAVERYKRSIYGVVIGMAASHPAATKAVGGIASVTGTVFKGLGALGQYAHSYNEIRRSMEMVRNTANATATAKKGLALATDVDSAAEKAKTVVANTESAALLRNAGAARAAGAAKMGAASAAGGGGMMGLLGMPAGGAIAASPAASLALMAGTAYGGWELGSWIARSANIGGAGDLARAQKEQRELEAEIGSKVGEENAGFTERWKAARKRHLTGGGPQGTAERTGDGELVIRVQGGAGVSADEMEDYADMM